jgi:hypothetical protein
LRAKLHLSLGIVKSPSQEKLLITLEVGVSPESHGYILPADFTGTGGTTAQGVPGAAVIAPGT